MGTRATAVHVGAAARIHACPHLAGVQLPAQRPWVRRRSPQVQRGEALLLGLALNGQAQQRPPLLLLLQLLQTLPPGGGGGAPEREPSRRGRGGVGAGRSGLGWSRVVPQRGLSEGAGEERSGGARDAPHLGLGLLQVPAYIEGAGPGQSLSFFPSDHTVPSPQSRPHLHVPTLAPTLGCWGR